MRAGKWARAIACGLFFLCFALSRAAALELEDRALKGLRALALDWLAVLLPRWSGLYRVAEGSTPFGMLKWLEPALEKGWDWSAAGYLGLAFD